MGVFPNLTGIGEQKVFVSARKLISNSQKSSRLFEEILSGSVNLDKLHELKSQSYEELFNLSNSITSGGVSPNLIPDLLQLLVLEYRIMDMIFVLSRSFARYRLKNPSQRRYVVEKLRANNELVSKAIAEIYIMHTVDRLDEIKRLRSRVKLIEEEGDEIKEDMLNYAYNTKTDYKTFYHIINLAYISDDVLDSCEDAADMLMNIMLSIAT